MKPPHIAPTILMLTSYPPRPCGIATFSQDLLQSIVNAYGKSYQLRVAALENRSRPQYSYPSEVWYRVNTQSEESIHRLAVEINANEAIQLIILQHEFGLWGGEYGENLKELLRLINKPMITIFHSVIPNPDERRKKLIQFLEEKSSSLIVMTHHAATILQKEYEILESKTFVIPHGTHPVAWRGQHKLKKKYGYEGHLVLSTFGLLGPNKNIETSLKALPALTKDFPNLKFLILGQTHPELIKSQGESYREQLEELMKELHLTTHVHFVNRYLDLPELLEYLKLTDIYLFSSKDPNQAVSGTFAYAMSCGSPVISTPIPHALETLDHETGAFFSFEDSEGLVKAIYPILENGALRKKMALNAYQKMRATLWHNVAIQYQQLIRKALPHVEAALAIPPIKLDHIKRMTDAFGIIQFSKIEKADLSSGYTLDDNARALIAVSSYYTQIFDPTALPLSQQYFRFIKYCQQDNGKFQNYVDAEGNFQSLNHYVNLEDSNGRAIWALGKLIAEEAYFPFEMIEEAEEAFRNTLSWIPQLSSPRAMGFAIKGLYQYYRVRPAHRIKGLILYLADQLLTCYYKTADGSWLWFENYLTYANSLLPEALLYAYIVSGHEQYQVVAEKSFHFLLSQIYHNGQFSVISNRGWLQKNNPKPESGEQPIDVASAVLSLDLFYKVMKDPIYQKLKKEAFSWFLGNNKLQQIVYDPISGGCGDGLEPYGVNLNKGAESFICYLMARLHMEESPWEETSTEPSASLQEDKRKTSPAPRATPLTNIFTGDDITHS